jgi:hypothetical protein
MEERTAKYYQLKEELMPSMDKAQADPLDEGYEAYTKSLELQEFIKGDLNRLYMGGIEDEYFQTDYRQEVLSSILMLWCMQHTDTSYRQGMHEIVAPILYALERELECYSEEEGESSSSSSSSSSRKASPLGKHITRAAVEANGFWMFSAVMDQIEPFYDPNPRKRGIENVTDMVHFCTVVQDRYLGEIDQELSHFLSVQGVYAQIYGMRWSRLLFGREFPMSHTHALRLWDFLFCSMWALGSGSSSSSSADPAPEVTKQAQQQAPRLIRRAGAGAGAGAAGEAAAGADSNGTAAMMPPAPPRKSGCNGAEFSLLINLCGDVMLAMLISMRVQLLESDSSECLGLLMHYPEGASITTIIRTALDIRQGTCTIAESPASSRRDTGSASASTGAGGAVPGSASKPAGRPNWLAASNTSSSLDRRGSASGQQQLQQPSPHAYGLMEQGGYGRETGGSRIGNDGNTQPAIGRTFNEKASRGLSKGLGKIERGVGSITKKLGEGAVFVGSAVEGAFKGNNTASSSTVSSSTSSSYVTVVGSSRDLEDELFGADSSPSAGKNTARAVDSFLSSSSSSSSALSNNNNNKPSVLSPTTSALCQPAPVLATPSKDRARQRAEAASSKATATNSAIADRLLDVSDDLGRSNLPYREEMAARKSAAARLRLMAALLDGSTSESMTEYDAAAAQLTRGGDVVAPAVAVVPAPIVAPQTDSTPEFEPVAAPVSVTMKKEKITTTSASSGSGSGSVSSGLYDDDTNAGSTTATTTASAAVTTASVSSSEGKGQQPTSTSDNKSKSQFEADLSFLDEEDGDDDFMFLSKPKQTPTKSSAGSVTDDAFAMLLGE